MTKELFTSLKRIETSFRPATGKSTREVYDIYDLAFINGNWHLGRKTFNGYTYYGYCQFGASDTRKRCAEWGVPLT
jgi:hypothetical protein